MLARRVLGAWETPVNGGVPLAVVGTRLWPLCNVLLVREAMAVLSPLMCVPQGALTFCGGAGRCRPGTPALTCTPSLA